MIFLSNTLWIYLNFHFPVSYQLDCTWMYVWCVHVWQCVLILFFRWCACFWETRTKAITVFILRSQWVYFTWIYNERNAYIFYCVPIKCVSPWYNCTGWLGIKNTSYWERKKKKSFLSQCFYGGPLLSRNVLHNDLFGYHSSVLINVFNRILATARILFNRQDLATVNTRSRSSHYMHFCILLTQK